MRTEHSKGIQIEYSAGNSHHGQGGVATQSNWKEVTTGSPWSWNLAQNTALQAVYAGLLKQLWEFQKQASEVTCSTGCSWGSGTNCEEQVPSCHLLSQQLSRPSWQSLCPGASLGLVPTAQCRAQGKASLTGTGHMVEKGECSKSVNCARASLWARGSG